MIKRLSINACVLGLALTLPPAVALSADTKSSGKLSRTASNFVTEAAQGGLMEVELGKIAQQKATDQKVQQFGKRMEQDHSKANEELKKTASDKGIELANELDKKHKSKVDKLSKLSGAEFDRQYMQAMISDHKQDIEEFQSEAKKEKDPDLQKYARQTLPTLQEHLQLAESAGQQVKAAEKSNSR